MVRVREGMRTASENPPMRKRRTKERGGHDPQATRPHPVSNRRRRRPSLHVPTFSSLKKDGGGLEPRALQRRPLSRRRPVLPASPSKHGARRSRSSSTKLHPHSRRGRCHYRFTLHKEGRGHDPQAQWPHPLSKRRRRRPPLYLPFYTVFKANTSNEQLMTKVQKQQRPTLWDDRSACSNCPVRTNARRAH